MPGQWRRQAKGQQQTGGGSNAPQIVATVFDAIKLVGSDPSGTPDANTLYKGLIPKGWLHYDQTGTPAILDDENVSGVTDDAAGRYTVTVERAFSAADAWVAVVCAGTASTAYIHMSANPTVDGASFRSDTRVDGAAALDVTDNMIVFFGRQA